MNDRIGIVLDREIQARKAKKYSVEDIRITDVNTSTNPFKIDADQFLIVYEVKVASDLSDYGFDLVSEAYVVRVSDNNSELTTQDVKYRYSNDTVSVHQGYLRGTNNATGLMINVKALKVKCIW